MCVYNLYENRFVHLQDKTWSIQHVCTFSHTKTNIYKIITVRMSHLDLRPGMHSDKLVVQTTATSTRWCEDTMWLTLPHLLFFLLTGLSGRAATTLFTCSFVADCVSASKGSESTDIHKTPHRFMHLDPDVNMYMEISFLITCWVCKFTHKEINSLYFLWYFNFNRNRQNIKQKSRKTHITKTYKWFACHSVK